MQTGIVFCFFWGGGFHGFDGDWEFGGGVSFHSAELVARARRGAIASLTLQHPHIEGPGFDGVYSIYQGHLFFQKATYAHA